MKIYEYQAKQVMAKYGIRVPRGKVAFTPEEAQKAAAAIGGRVAVKAQVHVGGRGKAGGIAIADTPEAACEAAARILGIRIGGYTVGLVWVEEALDIAEEYYAGITLDRARKRPVLMVSREGGVNIEEVAERSPDRIIKVWIDTDLGLREFHARHAAVAAGLSRRAVREIAGCLVALYKVYRNVDATLAEINPLVVTRSGEVVAADSKIAIDDNAAFRQAELVMLSDVEAGHPLEERARKEGLTYVKLDGNVGVMGNGAGLVMTTLDVISREGGKAANFMDIGGGAGAGVVKRGLALILSDPDVRSVLVNVFGGITRCDEVAKGIVEATKDLDIRVPIIVRLRGTMEEEGNRILAAADFATEPDFRAAARRAVEAARG